MLKDYRVHTIALMSIMYIIGYIIYMYIIGYMRLCYRRSYHTIAQRIKDYVMQVVLRTLETAHPHSAKGGAVETGCSALHQIIGCFI